MSTDSNCPSCGKPLPTPVAGELPRCPECNGQPTARDAHETTSFTGLSENISHSLVAQATECDDGYPEAMPVSLGRFQLVKLLGQGGFGAVYLAHDPQLDRDVALKVPRPGTLNSREHVERFLREARAAAQLRHPNIVPVYDAGKIDDTYYIAVAYVDGQPLRTRIGDFDQLAAAELIAKLAWALDYAHQRRVVHRDVKPENVLIDALGEPQVMDFGLAHWEGDEQLLTREGAVMGTHIHHKKFSFIINF